MKRSFCRGMAALGTVSVVMTAMAGNAPRGGEIMSTAAYRWVGDTIFQGPFKAYAAGADHIVSD